MNNQAQQQFIYLFERVGEPLYFSPRGRDRSEVIYNIPNSTITCSEIRDAAKVTRGNFGSSSSNARTVTVAAPKSTPNLSNIATLCPRSSLYNFFNTQHRKATQELRELLLQQRSLEDLLSIACVCRDSPMINCKLWINAFAGCMLTHPLTRNFEMPAVWEIMPDQFFTGFTMRQAFREAEMPEIDRGVIVVDNPQTGRNINPENRLAYWREDVGINSHHWHWHLIYRLEDPRQEGRRKGELFYYMHHAMIARYNAERLANNLPRVRPLTIDDNPVLKEGYFAKLLDSNSGQNWGTRQDNTPLRSLNRTDDPNLPAEYRNVTLEQLRKLRDRIMEAIDTGMVIDSANRRKPLDIDMLGDLVEASSLSPNPQFYGREGFHNIGHMIIAYSHDPDYRHLENAQPMADTVQNMRDPIFHRWHKYIDVIFDTFKQTLPPYQLTGKQEEFPLIWSGVQVQSISVQSTASGSRPNQLTSFFMSSNTDLSRGLDFTRTDVNRLGPIWLRFSHLNHDPFNYSIIVRNTSNSNQRATVRIFLAPRLNEHGEQFVMTQQRKLFFEMDKFTHQLRPGDNTITRSSVDSTLTIPWEQTFRELDRKLQEPTAQQSICGCGWPQHMLLPRGTTAGQTFDLLVFLTNAEEDKVTGTSAPAPPSQGSCRESLSFCGRLNQPYPDKKPMGYPFDRLPFAVKGQTVSNLEQYVSQIPNMKTAQIKIVHDAKRKVMRSDGGPTGIREISGDPSTSTNTPMCPDQGRMPAAGSAGGTRPNKMETASPTRPGGGSRPQSPSPSPSPSPPPRGNGGNGGWWSGGSWGGGGWSNGGNGGSGRYGGYGGGGGRRQSPKRPGSPQWGWGG